MLIAILIIAAVFAVLALVRVGGARRTLLLRHWPAVVLAVGAIYAAARGALWPAVLLAVAAGLAWWMQDRADRRAAAPKIDLAEAEARCILGLGQNATAAEIRAAYRAKMATAHPDRGGSHDQAARLTAARDRLLKR